MVKTATSIVILGFLLGGCASMEKNSPNMSVCIAAGAAAGAVAGGAARDTEAAISTALLGGLAGAILCSGPGDADADGVNDDLDRCPNTLARAKVDSRGCELDDDGDGVVNSVDACPATPKGATIDLRGCPLDGDRDGVIDLFDKCPNTAAGMPVDKNGCDADSDADGVNDRDDQCPDTLAGATVNKQGCEIIARLNNLTFELNSAVLQSRDEPQLLQAIELLRSRPAIQVRVAGHTDGSGTNSYNQKLSEARARAVCNRLIDAGIADDRLHCVGYGEERPIASNVNKADRQLNRRVEISVLAD